MVDIGPISKISIELGQPYLEVIFHSIQRTMLTVYPGPPGAAGQPGAERGGHQILLYPVRRDFGWGGLCCQSPGRPGAAATVRRVSWPQPVMSTRGERPARSDDGDRRTKEVNPQLGDHCHHKVRHCFHCCFQQRYLGPMRSHHPLSSSSSAPWPARAKPWALVLSTALLDTQHQLP